MIRPSDLENAILQEYYKRYKDYGFPEATEFEVLSRNNFGSGRSTKLNHKRVFDSPDGSLYLGKYSHLEIGKIEAGATFWMVICSGKVAELVIVINGEEHWDGNEITWFIVVPETANLSARIE